MFHLYLLALCAFLVWRLVLPLSLRPPWKVLAGLALLVLMQHHLLNRLVFGNMFSPEVPFALLVMVAWGFGTGVLVFPLIVLLDGAALVSRRRGRRPTARLLNLLRLASLGVAMAGAGVGVYNSVQVPPVTRVELAIDNLPAGLDGLNVVQLSDLHISRLLQGDWVAAVVARTNALRPDLVLITGDLIDGAVAARAADVAPLRGLRAAMGVIAIPGNHEYYFDEPAWSRAFTALGMRVLSNDHVEVGYPEKVAGASAGGMPGPTDGQAQVLAHVFAHTPAKVPAYVSIDAPAQAPGRGGTIVVAGINDAAASAYGLPGPDLAAALHGVDRGRPVILLAHRPADALAHARRGVDLQLSGHTHGGMIRGFDAVVRWANDGYVSGLYQVDGMQLYVSNGTGIWNGFPFRLGVPADITQFVLRARTPS